MASFVMHHVAGVQFLKKINETYKVKIEEEKIYNFLLGNLIVDSSNIKLNLPDGLTKEELIDKKNNYRLKIQQEKIATHFRNEEDEKLCIQVPNISLFIEKYKNLISCDFSSLGYLFHLYTDNLFFGYLFNKTFQCLDSYQNKTNYLCDLKYIRILKNNKLVLAQDFFSGESQTSLYKDYTVMNKMILMKYNIDFDLQKMNKYTVCFNNPGIKEVNYKNVSTVINQTHKFINDSCEIKDSKLNVFKEDEVYDFIDYVGIKFLEEYKDVILQLLKKNNEKQIIKSKKFN